MNVFLLQVEQMKYVYKYIFYKFNNPEKYKGISKLTFLYNIPTYILRLKMFIIYTQ